jgi:hypothetical protein
MTPDEYVKKLEQRVSMFDSAFVTSIRDWSVSDRLYVCLHKIQLNYMNHYLTELEDIKEALKVKGIIPK